ncbi:ARID2 [Acrasis kona]|uniref:ARID2 n=1 Tax=Acrasis kona TaxID=1008807 RepID=A0AAW2YH08_9EUKA
MDEHPYDMEEGASDEKIQFYSNLNKFMKERGTPIGKLPHLGGRTLDLYKLYKKVTELGGTEQVTDKKLWKDVTNAYKVPKTCTSASYSLRNHYKRYLFAYEQVNFFGKKDVVEAPPPPTTNKTYDVRANSPINDDNEPLPTPPREKRHLDASSIQQMQPQFLRKPKSVQQQQHTENMRRIECSVQCGADPHVFWALTRIAQLSCVPAAKQVKPTKGNGFHIGSIRGLLPLLLRRLALFIDVSHDSQDDYFNKITVSDRLTERVAFMSLIVLRNCSFEQSSKETIATAVDEVTQHSTLMILMRLLAIKSLHLEWKTKMLDTLVNISRFLKLPSKEDELEVIFHQIQSHVCGCEGSLVVLMLDLLNYLVSSDSQNSERVKHNAQIIGSKLSSPVYKNTLSELISFLITSTAVNHINEPSQDEIDDEGEQVEEEQEEQEDDDEDEESENGSDAELSQQPKKKKRRKDLESLNEDDVARHHTLDQQKRQQDKLKQQQQNVTAPQPYNSKLDDLSLLCRVNTLNLLSRLIPHSPKDFITLISSTNQCITRMIELLVWKSGLRSRMKYTAIQVSKNLREQQRVERHKQAANKIQQDPTLQHEQQAQYQHSTTIEDVAEDEDFDQDEYFDDLGEQDASNLDLSSSQIFQKKCGLILSLLAKNSEEAKLLLSSHQQEIMNLVVYTKSPVSNLLLECVTQ